MMRVADLQQLIAGLVQPVQAAGGSEKVCAELLRASECLAPFQNSNLQEFTAFLVKAEECVRTGTWPSPGTKARSGTSRSTAMTVEQAAQRLMAMMERANEPDLNPEAIDAELQPMESMPKPDLLRAAQEIGMNLASRTSKQDIIDAFRRRIREGRPSLNLHSEPQSSPSQQSPEPAVASDSGNG